MADQIKHGSVEVVNASAKITDSALSNVITAVTIAGNTTSIPNFQVDVKGRVIAASNTAVKMTGVDFEAAGNTLVDQTIFVNTSAPANNAVGANGDVWYQTIA
jgi:hypothetical protein|tara:strand:- start:1304 stop:1612 length:309 start_codon:yes stop_codon:yes gene_type:complete